MKPKHHINDLLRNPGGSKTLALILLQRLQSSLIPTGATRQDRTRAVGVDDYGRGTLGECLDVLLYEDSNVVAKMHITINLLLKGEHQKQAVRAATLALTHACDQEKEVSRLMQQYPALLESDWFREVAAAVHQGSRILLLLNKRLRHCVHSHIGQIFLAPINACVTRRMNATRRGYGNSDSLGIAKRRGW
jgi:hypothetical protein